MNKLSYFPLAHKQPRKHTHTHTHTNTHTHTIGKHNTQKGANKLLGITDKCCVTVSIIRNGAPGVEGYVARDEP